MTIEPLLHSPFFSLLTESAFPEGFEMQPSFVDSPTGAVLHLIKRASAGSLTLAHEIPLVALKA